MISREHDTVPQLISYSGRVSGAEQTALSGWSVCRVPPYARGQMGVRCWSGARWSGARCVSRCDPTTFKGHMRLPSLEGGDIAPVFKALISMGLLAARGAGGSSCR